MSESSSGPSPEHFEGKEAIQHVVEAQTRGVVDSSEIHGTEMPGHISAGADAAKEIALGLLLVWTALSHCVLDHRNLTLGLVVFGSAWTVWKMGRSALLGWARLERLHRLVEQERWEIQHHRRQEREELAVMYQAKGFEGKLLEDVCDVLMADNDRLLRVMLEEELGLTLGVHEHPLKQAMGALTGCVAALAICLPAMMFLGSPGIIAGCLVVVGAAAGISAHYQRNQLIPAIVWNVGLGAFVLGTCIFLLDLIYR